MSISRRWFVSAIPAFVAGVSASAAETLIPTPRQTEGPFYPRRFPVDADADLAQIAGRSARAKGQITYLAGTLVSDSGTAIAGADVEIWQCDANGVYHHIGSLPPGADPDFQGYGKARTDAAGAFRFRTIRPVPYPGRTPHIHVIVSGRGIPRLTTQLYVAGEPLNARDGPLNGIADAAARRSLMMDLVPASDIEPGALLAKPRIVLRA